MKLEPPFSIAESKLTQYLLVPLLKNDKSNYLRLAGYEITNWPILEKDLQKLVQTEEAKAGIPNGYFVEAFNALGKTIAVFVVHENDIETLTDKDVLSRRTLETV
jgi:hypothetical protein